MSHVAVFGGSGFLGSYVADELANRGHKVLIADLKESKYLKNGQEFLKCDIMKPDTLDAAVEGKDVVYNFAGFPDLDESFAFPKATIEQNVIGNLNILEQCRGRQLDRFVYASSAYALSNKGGLYGVSKLASEKIVEEYSDRYDIPFTIIRYGSLYGERANESNGVYQMLREALTEGQINHQGNGEEFREYIHAIDAAILSVDVLDDESYSNKHTILTGVERMKQKDLLRMIQEVLNNNIKVNYSHEKKAGHYEVTPYSYHPNTARKLVSKSFIDLGQGLVSCIQHLDAVLTDKE